MAEITLDADQLQLTTERVLRPERIEIATGTTFTTVYTARPAFLISLAATPPSEIDYAPYRPTTEDAALLKFHRARSGVAFLYARGYWYVRHNGAGTESFVKLDAGGQGMADQVAAASTPASETVDVVRIGGTLQTGLNVTSLLSNSLLAGLDTGYVAANAGRRFFYTHQTPGTLVTGQTSFVATTPTFLLSNTSASRIIVRSISLSQGGTVAGGPISVVVQLNTTDEFSAGGTTVTAANPNEGSALSPAAGITFRTNPTATGAAGRVILQAVVPASLGTSTEADFEDSVILGATSSSLSVFSWAATTAPTWAFVVDVEVV